MVSVYAISINARSWDVHRIKKGGNERIVFLFNKS